MYLLRIIVDDGIRACRCCDHIEDEQGSEVLGGIMKITYDQDVDVLRVSFQLSPN